MITPLRYPGYGLGDWSVQAGQRLVVLRRAASGTPEERPTRHQLGSHTPVVGQRYVDASVDRV